MFFNMGVNKSRLAFPTILIFNLLLCSLSFFRRKNLFAYIGDRIRDRVISNCANKLGNVQTQTLLQATYHQNLAIIYSTVCHGWRCFIMLIPGGSFLLKLSGTLRRISIRPSSSFRSLSLKPHSSSIKMFRSCLKPCFHLKTCVKVIYRFIRLPRLLISHTRSYP